MKGIVSIGLLIITNIFIFCLVWPLKFKEFKSLENIGIFATIMITGCCFFYMSFQVPANKMGSEAMEVFLTRIKVIQEIIALFVL
jgi:uncharacterized protein (DUF486 family)